jgi:AcrR family transcriptional regulator
MPGDGTRDSNDAHIPANKPVAAPEVVDLETKVEPSQDRARNTFETILTVTGDLLGEVGFERLSTNMVCKRAGISPPALYRYFPNKYAILRELGRRLMDAQDEAVFEWIREGGVQKSTFEDLLESCLLIQSRVNDITRTFPGGAWILRVMRVIPVLREVRVESRQTVADSIRSAAQQAFPGIPEARLATVTKLTTEMMYAATEMAIEEPDLEEEITREACIMVASYYTRLTGIE